MGQLHWNIFDGAEFESLMQTMLLVSNPGMVTFGRPGPDHGMDAISADGKHVYQAKFRMAMSMRTAIDLAKSELAKIATYKNPKDTRHKYWKNVTDWTLLANIEKNPNDAEAWNCSIVPEFAKYGIRAHYKDIDTLEAELALMPEVREAYFGGENRVFFCLGEVYRSMSREVTGKYVDEQIIGQDKQLEEVARYMDDEGVNYISVEANAGMGKTRFLYECGVRLANAGWRVLWGRQDSMLSNPNWARSVNTARRTCVIIESIYDEKLVNILVDQLSLTEKKTWKVIAATTPEVAATVYAHVSSLPWFKKLGLTALTDAQVELLFKKHLSAAAQSLALKVAANNYSWTGGRPGWVFLMMALSRYMPSDDKVVVAGDMMQRAWLSIDEIMKSFPDSSRVLYMGVLRWMCIWRSISIESSEKDSVAVEFLANEFGARSADIRSAIDELSRVGLLCSWGEKKKYYVAEPEFIRQRVLSGWLLKEVGDRYIVSEAGSKIVSRLIQSQIPYKEAIFSNLASLTIAYLDDGERATLLLPVLEEMEKSVPSLGIPGLTTLVEWVGRIGHACPEISLDILNVIRIQERPDEIIDNGLWGKMRISIKDVLAKLPQCVLSISDYASSAGCSRKCWNLLSNLANDEQSGKFTSPNGSGALDKINAVLVAERVKEEYLRFAIDDLEAALQVRDYSKRTEILVRALTSIERSSVGSMTRRTVVFSRWIIAYDGIEWRYLTRAIALVKNAFGNSGNTKDDRIELWRLIEVVFGNMYEGVSGLVEQRKKQEDAIGELMRDILNFAALQMKDVIELDEGVAARRTWESYLERGDDKDLLSLCNQCEDLFNSIVRWRYQDIITWSRAKDKNEHIDAIFKFFSGSNLKEEVGAFFEGALDYMRAATPDRPDDDCGAFCEIAVRCQGLFDPVSEAHTAYTDYVLDLLATKDYKSPLISAFAVFVIRAFIKDIKTHEAPDKTFFIIKDIFTRTKARADFFVAVYSDMSSNIVGEVTVTELEYSLSDEMGLTGDQMMSVMPEFLSVDCKRVLSIVEKVLCGVRTDVCALHKMISEFIFHSYLTVLRKKSAEECNPAKWIFDRIVEWGLDGNLLKGRELRYLFDHCGAKFKLSRFADFALKRIEIAKQKPPYERFEVLPYGFSAVKYFENDGDVDSFYEVCKAVVENNGYFSRTKIPAMLKELNPDGGLMSGFVHEYLTSMTKVSLSGLMGLSALAAVFEDSSQEWQSIAEPVLLKADEMDLHRDDKVRLYVHLGPMTKSWCGVAGEIPQIFVDRKNSTERMLLEADKSSPMYAYRKWAAKIADGEYRDAADRAEAEKHE